MSKKKILIIDDDESVRQVFAIALTHMGYETIIAEDGVVGLEMYNEHRPDMVITDMAMPRKTGREVIEEIRRQSPDQKIIAAAAVSQTLKDAIDAGVDGVLEKPFSIRDLGDKIKAWLG